MNSKHIGRNAVEWPTPQCMRVRHGPRRVVEQLSCYKNPQPSVPLDDMAEGTAELGPIELDR